MRLDPDQRRSVIITAALRIARDNGLASVNHSTVCARCVIHTSKETVKHYYPTRNDLWRAVVAVDSGLFDQGKELGL